MRVHLNLHSATHLLQITLPMLPGFVSVPWNPFPCGKIELQVESAQEEEKKGMEEDLQHKFPKQTFPFPFGEWSSK